MKSYILNLTTYGMNGEPVDYDYDTAAGLWNEIDKLNETAQAHLVTLTETIDGALIIGVESNGRNDFPARIERYTLSRQVERIADEYGAFELPERYLMGEPELNELISITA